MSDTENLEPGDVESGDLAPDDPLRDAAESKQTVTNDSVAGETVYPGAGEGNDGPTGGAPSEIQPEYAEHEDEIILEVNATDDADSVRGSIQPEEPSGE